MTRSDELATEVARERLDMQFQQIDGLDTKAAALLGFTGVVLALLFNSETVKDGWNAAFVVASVAFSLGVIALGYAILPRGFKYNPSVPALIRWSRYSPATTATLVSRSIRLAMTHNRRRMDHKLRGLQLGGAFIIVGVVALAIGLITSVQDTPRTVPGRAVGSNERVGDARGEADAERARHTPRGGERRSRSHGTGD